MREVIFILIAAALTFTACSSDEPGWDDDGNGGGGSISPNTLNGRWDFSKYILDIQIDDPEVAAIAEKNQRANMSGSAINYPSSGYLLFEVGKTAEDNSPDYIEGRVTFSRDPNIISYEQEDYYTRNDSIMTVPPSHWLTAKPARVYIKKGNMIIKNNDATNTYQSKYPNAGVKRVYFEAEFVKR